MDRLAIPNSRRICTLSFRRNASSAFTVVELTVVIVLIGIMAAVFAPRFIGLSEFRIATSKNELLSVARFAQQAALWRGIGSRVQLVFDDPDSVVSPAVPSVKVVVLPVGAGGDGEIGTSDDVIPGCATGGGTVIRSIAMTEGKTYVPLLQKTLTKPASWADLTAPAGTLMVVQYDPLGTLDQAANGCPELVALDLAGDPASPHGDICLEPTGYAHEGECICDPATAVSTPGDGCNI